jgi:outer membrane protein OmpA-like peptidoglycan-associated protein
MAVQQSTETQALDQLKAILLDQEKQRIVHLEDEMKSLYDQLNDKEQLIESLDPIIADLLYKKILESKSQMAEALAPVMGGALRKQIADAKDDIADSLYPVIGKAVRKSVAEAIKNLVREINERIDTIVNQGFRFRKKIDRDLILKQSLPFYLKEIFLIHKKSGLLLSHASYKQDNNGKEDIISGMLSAIREFSKAAFSSGDQSLHEIQYEDLNIVIEEGKYACLAFVIEGIPTINFKEIIKELESKIHLRFFKAMRDFDGETESFDHVKDLLSGFITSVHEPLFKDALSLEKNKKPKGILYLFAVIIIIIALFIFIPFKDGVDGSQYEKIIQTYQNKPGSFFTVSMMENTIILKGAIFEADRKNLLDTLEEIDVQLESKNLFVLPTFESLQQMAASIQKDLKLKNTLSIVVDSTQLSLQGIVSNREKSLMAARLFAERSSIPIIFNEIIVQQDVFTIEDIKKLNIYFEPSLSELSNKSQQTLDSVLTVLDNVAINKITIQGYADSVGTDKFNQQVAYNRAEVVKKYFLEKGFPLTKINTTSQVLENQLKTSYIKSNRRVSFKVE